MPLLIQEIPVTHAPIELLLLADPSEEKIRSSLSGSKCFVAMRDARVVGACVVQPRGADSYELMSIAVLPEQQRSGYGTELLRWVIDFYRHAGARQIEPVQQRLRRYGSRVTPIVRLSAAPSTFLRDGTV